MTKHFGCVSYKRWNDVKKWQTLFRNWSERRRRNEKEKYRLSVFTICCDKWVQATVCTHSTMSLALSSSFSPFSSHHQKWSVSIGAQRTHLLLSHFVSIYYIFITKPFIYPSQKQLPRHILALNVFLLFVFSHSLCSVGWDTRFDDIVSI